MQKPRNIFFLCIGLLIAAPGLFISAPLARAQVGIVPDPVEYSMSPDAPGPGQQVSMSVQGVGTFIGDATITWSQNGAVVLSGVGASSYTVTTGALGSKMTVHVDVSSPSNGTFTHDFILQPSLVNLVWEADTTVPPLYRGKALYSAGSAVKVVAFPTVFSNGARVAANALSMQWFLDDNAVPEQSGLGRSIFSFTGDQLQSQENVAADVYYGSSKVGHGEVSIPVSQPLLLLYDKDPLRGTLYDSAIPGAVSLNTKEITLQAVPYFFSNSSLANGSLVYSWTLNGNDTTGPGSAQGMLTLRQTGSGQGAAAIGVTLQNNDSDKFVQTASAALQLIFGQSSGSLFGL